MNMFGLEGSGFFVSIMFTLLMSGAVVYFLTGKLKEVEHKSEEMRSALAETLGAMRGGASDEAVAAARELSARSSVPPADSSESENEDSSSEEESGEEDAECEEAVEIGSMPVVSAGMSMLPGAVIMSVGSVEMGLPFEEEVPEVKTVKLEDVADLDKLAISDEAVVEEVGKELSTSSVSLDDMKVPELKKLAHSIVGKEANKMRRSELVELLKSSTEKITVEKKDAE